MYIIYTFVSLKRHALRRTGNRLGKRGSCTLVSLSISFTIVSLIHSSMRQAENSFNRRNVQGFRSFPRNWKLEGDRPNVRSSGTFGTSEGNREREKETVRVCVCMRVCSIVCPIGVRRRVKMRVSGLDDIAG